MLKQLEETDNLQVRGRTLALETGGSNFHHAPFPSPPPPPQSDRFFHHVGVNSNLQIG